jgi:sulfur relay (sulfurtransferase) DsrC/TusE family protein
MFDQVSKKESSLKTQRNVRHITQKRRQIQENWEEIVENAVSQHAKQRLTCEKAALKIQKIVRGFLIRVKVEPLMLVIREKNSGRVIKDLREQTDLCMLSLGTATIPVPAK